MIQHYPSSSIIFEQIKVNCRPSLPCWFCSEKHFAQYCSFKSFMPKVWLIRSQGIKETAKIRTIFKTWKSTISNRRPSSKSCQRLQRQKKKVKEANGIKTNLCQMEILALTGVQNRSVESSQNNKDGYHFHNKMEN